MTLITCKPLDQLSSCYSCPEMRMQLGFTHSEITFQGIFGVLNTADPLPRAALCPEPSAERSRAVLLALLGGSQLLLPWCVRSLPLGCSLG